MFRLGNITVSVDDDVTKVAENGHAVPFRGAIRKAHAADLGEIKLRLLDAGTGEVFQAKHTPTTALFTVAHSLQRHLQQDVRRHQDRVAESLSENRLDH